MKILAFETSCDDTGVAIVADGCDVISNVRVSQVEHTEYGGVVPEIAARLHAENWRGTLEKCLTKAKMTIDDVDALAVTQGPGLQTSLLTGTTAASFLSQFFKKPLIPVQHIRGHINSVTLGRNPAEIEYPVLTLTVSGGHTDMFLQRSTTEVERIGGTLDDAAGEAFDKCAKMLGLGYPGGPIVSKQAESGNGAAFDFPRPLPVRGDLNFSFSGIKAAVHRLLEEQPDANVADVCASFEQAVVDVFVRKVGFAIDAHPDLRAVHFTGGVSANRAIREALWKLCDERGLEFRVPKEFIYCTDNAAMIAGEAFWQIQKNPELAQVQFVDAQPRMTS